LVAVKLPDYFSGLLDGTVNISDDRLRQLDAHVAAISACLRADENLGPVARRFLRQGSWAQRTIIAPRPGQELGGDVLVEMGPQRPWAADPKQYLLAVHGALRAAPRYRSLVELKTRCVRVACADDCHVNLVPYVHTPGRPQRHEIVNQAKNTLEQVNPGGFTDWMRDRDDLAAGHLRTTLRLLKYLRDDRQAFAVPSVILTVLVGGRVSWARSRLRNGYAELPAAFTRLVTDTDRWLQQRPDRPEISDPSCPPARFGHRLTQQEYEAFRDQFHGSAGQIQAAYRAHDRAESVALWRKIFGDGFAPA
jgi:hypothetical protein